jgi:hypothetical protein
MVNPDGIIAGNYRSNTSGNDMNRHFFADNDPQGKVRLTEVELIRTFMEENFSCKFPEKRAKLEMFLDIHGHSGARDIFIYAPSCENEHEVEKVKILPKILSEHSKYFSWEGCKFGNEKYKKNCARLGVFRDFNLPCSYTIESSCWGYTDPASDYTYQFKELDFLKFG